MISLEILLIRIPAMLCLCVCARTREWELEIVTLHSHVDRYRICGVSIKSFNCMGIEEALASMCLVETTPCLWYSYMSFRGYFCIPVYQYSHTGISPSRHCILSRWIYPLIVFLTLTHTHWNRWLKLKDTWLVLWDARSVLGFPRLLKNPPLSFFLTL